MPAHKLCRSIFAAVVITALLFGVKIADAQTGNAVVTGIVTDASGSVVAGAIVTLTNSASGDALTNTTGTDGRYTFPTVAPGTYTLTVRAATFSVKAVAGIQLILDQHLTESVVLQPGSQTTTVSVTAETSAVDTTAYDVGGVIQQTQIDTLPIQNRQYLNLGALIPGTTQGANRTFYNNLQSGSGLYFYASGFYLDGVTNQQTEEGDPRQNIPMGAVAEFKTYTSSYPIELGWAMGGFTTVVTKSGTNKIHGEAFEYYRNTAMTALNQFQQATAAAEHTGNPPYKRNQFGGDMGGPILKNRMHYYGAYDGTELTSSYTMFVAGAAAADFTAPGLLGTFPAPGHDRLATARWDYDLTARQQLFFRWAQEWNLVTRNGCGPTTTIGCYDGQIPRYAYVGGHTWEPNTHMVNEARFQYAYISYELGPWDTPIPTKPGDLTNPTYTTNVGVGYSFPDFGYGHTYAAVGVETRWEFNDTLTIEHGTHQLKLGTDLSYVPYIDASASILNGEWIFSQDEVFNPANPNTLTSPHEFTQAAVPLLYYLPSMQQAYFIGDSWKAKTNLTFDYGLRWERQTGSPFLDTYTPNPAKPKIPFEGNPHARGDKRNFGPRLGFTYDPFKKGMDVIRGGAGIYYNFIETELSEAEKLNFVACPITLVNGSPAGYVLPYPSPAQYNGQSVTSFCSTAPPTVVILSPNLRNAYQYQYSLGYSRRISQNLSISADGLYSRGLRDYKIYDLNYPTLNGVPGIGGTRPYSTFTQIQQHASTGASEYKGLYLKLEKRLANRYMYSLSYALSSGLDNNPHSAPVSYVNPQSDWGPAAIDQRHAVVGSFSYLAPWKILVGGIFTFRSSLPFSVTTTTATCANPGAGLVLPTACNGVVGGGVLPSSALNADGTAQYVPGTKRDQLERNINTAAINLYRSQITGTSASGLEPVGSVTSTNYMDFDLRVSKSLYHHDVMDVQVFGQAFNLFGRENYNAITTSPTSTSFGLATSAQTLQPASDVQIGEIGGKFIF
jgi:carboxypeptidase family protein